VSLTAEVALKVIWNLCSTNLDPQIDVYVRTRAAARTVAASIRVYRDLLKGKDVHVVCPGHVTEGTITSEARDLALKVSSPALGVLPKDAQTLLMPGKYMYVAWYGDLWRWPEVWFCGVNSEKVMVASNHKLAMRVRREDMETVVDLERLPFASIRTFWIEKVRKGGRPMCPLLIRMRDAYEKHALVEDIESLWEKECDAVYVRTHELKDNQMRILQHRKGTVKENETITPLSRYWIYIVISQRGKTRDELRALYEGKVEMRAFSPDTAFAKCRVAPTGCVSEFDLSRPKWSSVHRDELVFEFAPATLSWREGSEKKRPVAWFLVDTVEETVFGLTNMFFGKSVVKGRWENDFFVHSGVFAKYPYLFPRGRPRDIDVRFDDRGREKVRLEVDGLGQQAANGTIGGVGQRAEDAVGRLEQPTDVIYPEVQQYGLEEVAPPPVVMLQPAPLVEVSRSFPQARIPVAPTGYRPWMLPTWNWNPIIPPPPSVPPPLVPTTVVRTMQLQMDQTDERSETEMED